MDPRLQKNTEHKTSMESVKQSRHLARMMRRNNNFPLVGKRILQFKFLYLVYVAHNHGREEDLRERNGHRVHSGHHGGVHEVDCYL